MSQRSTDLSDHERGSGSAGSTAATDFPLDYVHVWKDWCRMVGLSPVTAWREMKAGRGPIITKLSPRLTGVRHRNHLAWLAAREQHNHEAA
jgi:hypothetical protein